PRVGVAVGGEQHAWPGAAGDAWQAVDCVQEIPAAAVAAALETGADEPVHTVRRSRMSGGQLVATELLHIPAASVPGLTAIDAPSGAARARAVLRELHHLDLEGQDRAVELGSARADDARELDRLPGSPVLVVTTRFTAQGRIAALSVATYRADTCRLTFGDSAGVEIHHDPAQRAS
ncbi:UTRA domain-containing protein, partial [Streptomyces sp. SID685]